MVGYVPRTFKTHMDSPCLSGSRPTGRPHPAELLREQTYPHRLHIGIQAE
jgi:hypothetical protein